jgi:hypothetical protein
LLIGLEPSTSYTVAFHPKDPNVIYAGMANIKGIVSEDGGDTWRVMDPSGVGARNSMYSFAFDPEEPSTVYVATGKWPDYPLMWTAGAMGGKWEYMGLEKGDWTNKAAVGNIGGPEKGSWAQKRL